MMKVLVTGANGFLGYHLVRKLSMLNYEVKAMVRDASDISTLSELKCEIVKADILDFENLLTCAQNVDVVFHVAGAMSSSQKDNQRLFDVNVTGVKNIIRVCSELKIKRLIHVSSVVSVGVNLKETDPLLTEESFNITKELNFSNYDTKRIGEELVLSSAKNGKVDAVVVNPGLIYGSGDAKKIIRKGNIKAARGRLPFYTSGGVNIVAVEDVVEGMIAAIKIGKSGQRYLLTGSNITIKELLTTISKSAGARPPFIKLPSSLLKFLSVIHDFLGLKGQLSKENIFSATTFHWYDHSKAKKELNFHPMDYKRAIANSVNWMKENNYLEKL